MIGICTNCGNHHWDKEISEDKNRIICKLCNHQWNFKSLPLFILTGCSGVGKTTTAQELLQRETNYIVMDADILYNIMPHETEEDLQKWVEYIMEFSINIMQIGKPLLWTIAGALDKFEATYHRRFFTNIYYLALVCSKEALEKRMREGRHITNEDWIRSSIDYNQWFMKDGSLPSGCIDTYDITEKTVSEVADYVDQWVRDRVYTFNHLYK